MQLIAINGLTALISNSIIFQCRAWSGQPHVILLMRLTSNLNIFEQKS